MKTFKRILALCFVASTLLFAACSDKNNDNTSEGGEPFDLTNTSWAAETNSDLTYMGVQIFVHLNMTMDFMSTSEGELFMDVSLEMPAYPQQNQSQTETEPFTYTFDGRTLTFVEIDREEGDPFSDGMTYNPADQTFTMMVPDENLDGMSLHQLIGTDRIIFHKVR